MTDPTSAQMVLINQFYTYFLAGNYEDANAILTANPDLLTCFHNAEKYNNMLDGLKALQQHHLDFVDSYILSVWQDRGEWDDEIEYDKFDVVYVVDEIDSNIKVYYVCKDNNTPIGTVPTDTEYFYCTTIQGVQGISGLGLSPRGIWSSGITYYVDDWVSHNNAFWQCLVENSNSEPDDENTDWGLMLVFNTSIVASKTQPTGQAVGDWWLRYIDEGEAPHYPIVNGAFYNRCTGVDTYEPYFGITTVENIFFSPSLSEAEPHQLNTENLGAFLYASDYSLYSGWRQQGYYAFRQEWTYVNSYAMSTTDGTPSDMVPGTKVKVTQGSYTSYLYVASISTNAGTTLVTFAPGTKYSLVVGTIDSVSVGITEHPYGFEHDQSYQATLSGFSTNPPGSIYKFSISGQRCRLNLYQANTGISNSNIFTISLPVIASSSLAQSGVGWRGYDGGVLYKDSRCIFIYPGGSIAYIYAGNGNQTGWETSGAKSLNMGTIDYIIDT